MPTLRRYQSLLEQGIQDAWAQLYAAGSTNPVVMGVLPTGGGKTVVFSEVIRKEPRASCAIAHRSEIVSQISLALASAGVRHKIIGSSKTRKKCQKVQLKKLKRHYVDPNSKCAVASVKTLAKMNPADPWFAQVALWVGDEGHHFLRANEWGRAVGLFPHARGLLVTATPCRADGAGLGRNADGFVDTLLLGPTMRELINMGYLVDYEVACPESDVNIANVELGADGDFKQNQLRKAFHESGKICGDIVTAYETYTTGKLAVVFSVDVEEARKTAAEFNRRGIKAAVVSAETDDDVRDHTLREFEARRTLVLINVDLFGEGYDLPNLEVVILARHTESFSLYCQQWGRGTRLDISPDLMARWDAFTDAERLAHIAASNKPRMYVLDLVGNFIRHNGPPDQVRPWTMNRREKRTSNSVSDAIPYRRCANRDSKYNGSMIPCDKPYVSYLARCPYCDFAYQPPSRTAPEYVEGNIAWLDASTLERLRGQIAAVAAPSSTVIAPPGMPVLGVQRLRNLHVEKQQAQAQLRNVMDWCGALLETKGAHDIGERWSRFYYLFGIDVATAQTLGTADANALRERIYLWLAKNGIDGAVNSGLH